MILGGTVHTKHRLASAAWAVTGSMAIAVIAVVGSPVSAPADPPPPARDWTRTETRNDCTDYSPLRNPYFGDTHVHTAYSADAVLARTRNLPRDAYAFAKGDPVGLPPYDAYGDPGRTAQIEAPLDFTAVTDHAEGFGEAQICLEPGYDGFNDQLCADLRDTFTRTFHPTNPLPGPFIQFFTALSLPEPFNTRFEGICGPGPDYADCATVAGLVWQDSIDAAEENYDSSPSCDFTTFIAYEWSGNTSGDNLHRNVIFRNAEVPPLPITYYEEGTAEGLWAQLQAQCLDEPGQCDVLAIPHNSNIARKYMFNDKASDGSALTAAQAATRASFEPIMELTQIKGDSECRDGVIGTTDELCSFEKLSRVQLLGTSDWTDSRFERTAYARGALKLGLGIESTVGVNPFQLGFIGATDTHNGTPGATSERDYARIGFSGIADSELPFILADATAPSKVQANGGGLSVVWAEENSRDAIFSAMRRRETYSTSGTRPIVRSFAGNYPKDLCTNGQNFVAEGYDKGVPMGGEIGPVRGKRSPRFAILANQDPGNANRVGTPLQRIQVVKGWIDDVTRATFEEVYDVAGNAKNGAGVDDDCEETGADGGFASLCAVWEDPKFKPEQKAFYYVRVLENPVCRWSHRICNQLKTCSVPLTACSGDKYRTCTTDAECVTANAGSTCSLPYTAICTNNEDCSNAGAGSCGSTPAVDCSSPGSLPAAAEQCCDEDIAKTIQERAVASPIWYHPNQVGITKGRIIFDQAVGEDSLQLGLLIGQTTDDLYPETNDLTFTLRDDAGPVWTATVPMGTMDVKKPELSYSYKGDGSLGGITGLTLKFSKPNPRTNGKATFKIKTGDIDLSGLDRVSQRLWLDVTSGAYSSTAVVDWQYKEPKMSVVF